jgi:hypothetical protein
MAGKKNGEGAPAVELSTYRAEIIKAEDMPYEAQRNALGLFDQLVARGVTPDKAAYTTATTLYGHYLKHIKGDE